MKKKPYLHVPAINVNFHRYWIRFIIFAGLPHHIDLTIFCLGCIIWLEVLFANKSPHRVGVIICLFFMKCKKIMKIFIQMKNIMKSKAKY